MSATIPGRRSAIYQAAELIYLQGSQTEADVFRAIDFGTKRGASIKALDNAIAQGWLMRLADGRIALPPETVDHLDECPPATPPYRGEVASPRVINLLQRPPISAKYRLNPRGTRSDVPEWSVRATPSFKTVA